MSSRKIVDFDSNLSSLNRKRYDVMLLPIPEAGEFDRVGFAQLFVGNLFLTGVLQLEVDRGNVITAHRVDGGYALTQRGGANDDRVFVRLLLTGANRFFIAEYLSFLTANKKSMTLIARAVRLLRCQIESFKIVETTERRQAMIIHLIFRQLRTFQDTVSYSVANFALASLAGSSIMAEENLYDSRQASGAINVIEGLLEVEAPNLFDGMRSFIDSFLS